MFFSCCGGAYKFHLVKAIYNIILKTLFKDPEKPRSLLLGPTRISTVNIGGSTIHVGLGIEPETKLLGLNVKSKAALRDKLSKVFINNR